MAVGKLIPFVESNSSVASRSPVAALVENSPASKGWDVSFCTRTSITTKALSCESAARPALGLYANGLLIVTERPSSQVNFEPNGLVNCSTLGAVVEADGASVVVAGEPEDVVAVELEDEVVVAGVVSDVGPCLSLVDEGVAVTPCCVHPVTEIVTTTAISMRFNSLPSPWEPASGGQLKEA